MKTMLSMPVTDEMEKYDNWEKVYLFWTFCFHYTLEGISAACTCVNMLYGGRGRAYEGGHRPQQQRLL